MFESITDLFRETIDAIQADNDRVIGIFVIPLLLTIFATASQFTVLVNQQQGAINQALLSSGICNTYQPYLITSILGTFANDPLAHVGMCQEASFNIMIFLAWYVESFIMLMIVIIVFEAIFHMG